MALRKQTQKKQDLWTPYCGLSKRRNTQILYGPLTSSHRTSPGRSSFLSTHFLFTVDSNSATPWQLLSRCSLAAVTGSQSECQKHKEIKITWGKHVEPLGTLIQLPCSKQIRSVIQRCFWSCIGIQHLTCVGVTVHYIECREECNPIEVQGYCSHIVAKFGPPSRSLSSSAW